jgi:ABC-type antimicrobial peptide transport system permease subunit
MNLPAVGHDLRHTLRAATRTPRTTAALLLSLTLGTGANAAVFGVMRTLLLAVAAVVGALAVVVGLAAIVPLGHALRVNPIIALSDE